MWAELLLLQFGMRPGCLDLTGVLACFLICSRVNSLIDADGTNADRSAGHVSRYQDTVFAWWRLSLDAD